MNLKKILLGLVALIIILPALCYLRIALRAPIKVDLAKTEVPQDVAPNVVEANKVLVQDYFSKLYSADYATAIKTFLADNYIEHQISANFSKEGLETYVAKRVADYDNLEMIVHRVVAQGDLVFLHVEEKSSATDSFARAELFRVSGDKIIEHWSATQLIPNPPPPHGMLDGPKVNPTSEAGRKHLKDLLASLEHLLNYNLDVLPQYYTEAYIQHTPGATDGPGGFLFFVKIIRTFDMLGFTPTIENKIALAEGDFMVVLSLNDIPPIESNGLAFDILRLTEDGKKDEHWDVLETMESKDMISKVFKQ